MATVRRGTTRHATAVPQSTTIALLPPTIALPPATIALLPATIAGLATTQPFPIAGPTRDLPRATARQPAVTAPTMSALGQPQAVILQIGHGATTAARRTTTISRPPNTRCPATTVQMPTTAARLAAKAAPRTTPRLSIGARAAAGRQARTGRRGRGLMV